jgi:hypothetical protein
LLLILVLLAGAALAADTPQAIVRHVLGSGGQKVAAGPFTLTGTLGEPVVGTFVLSGDFRAASGYWRGLNRHGRAFLPMVIK